MAITKRGNSALVEVTSGSATPSLPGGTTAGDLLLMHIAHGATSAINPPGGDGWQVADDIVIASTHRMYLFWKFAGVGESNPTFSGTGANGMWGVLSGYAGVPIRANPFNLAPTAATGSGTSMTGTAMTATEDDCFALWFWTQSDNGTTSGASGGTANYIGSSYDSIVGIDASLASIWEQANAGVSTGTCSVASSSGTAWGRIQVMLDGSPLTPLPPLLRPEHHRVRHLLPR